MLASLSSGRTCSGNVRPSIMILAELPTTVPHHCVHGIGQTGYLFSLILQSTRLGEVAAPKLLPSEHLSEILVTITAGRKVAFLSGVSSRSDEGQEPSEAHSHCVMLCRRRPKAADETEVNTKKTKDENAGQ